MKFDYFIPTRILFGAGRLNALGQTPLPGKKALVVVSNGKSVRANGALDRTLAALGKQGVEFVLFDKIQANPTLEQVMQGAQVARENGCDFIVALGGGSVIDAGKAIAIMVRNPGNYWDYILSGSGKGKPVTEPVLPIVAITTTAGTGTEADPWAVVTNEAANEKTGFGLPQTFPVLSIVDPELMVSIPPAFTAYQGFDALFHACEGYLARIANPISDLFALKSISLIGKYLPKAVANGADIEARGFVALANTLSGMVESTSTCTSEHSLEHAMSAYHPALPHGAGLIMISLAYHAHFEPKAPARYRDMADALGAQAGESFCQALARLQKECCVDNLKMSDYSITREELPKIARNARETMGALYAVDPAPLSDADALAILEQSFR